MGLIFNEDGTYYNSTQDNKNIEIITANKTLTANDSGKEFHIGTDALVITLPATVIDLEYKFVNIAADGVAIITISPAAADGIHGTATLAASVVELSGVDDKDLINTKATATTGNCVKLTGDGITGWYASDFQGIWASEA